MISQRKRSKPLQNNFPDPFKGTASDEDGSVQPSTPDPLVSRPNRYDSHTLPLKSGLLHSWEVILEKTSSQGIGTGFKDASAKTAKAWKILDIPTTLSLAITPLSKPLLQQASKQLFTQAHYHLAPETFPCSPRNPSYVDMERIISDSLTFAGTASEQHILQVKQVLLPVHLAQQQPPVPSCARTQEDRIFLCFLKQLYPIANL